LVPDSQPLLPFEAPKGRVDFTFVEKGNVLGTALAIAGPGRAARAFARSWVSCGGRVGPIVSRHSTSAERFAREIGEGQPGTIVDARFRCEVLVLGVPDDAIEIAARELAPRVSCRLAFHLSGARPAELLAPFRAQRASVGSLHPLRAFHGDPAESWKDAFVAVEGDPPAVDGGVRIATALGARAREIPAKSKPLYHAAATLAAGGCLAVVSMAARVWASLGLPEEEARAALGRLGAEALASLEKQRFEDAFTGPISRRDVGTVRDHVAGLAPLADVLAVYRLLAEETIARTSGRGREDEMRGALESRNGKS
jgi:predicted short-subunit dehydrogenase-like oxidoreductase (DUF2520 family)